jgi:hypothetical protein
MISQRQADIPAGQQSRGAAPAVAPGLAALAAVVRVAVAKRADWGDTAQLAASALERRCSPRLAFRSTATTPDSREARSESR